MDSWAGLWGVDWHEAYSWLLLGGRAWSDPGVTEAWPGVHLPSGSTLHTDSGLLCLSSSPLPTPSTMCPALEPGGHTQTVIQSTHLRLQGKVLGIVLQAAGADCGLPSFTEA